MVEVDGIKRLDVFSKVAKPVYLGIIRYNYNYNPYQKNKITVEHYCKPCAITILEEMIEKNIRSFAPVNKSMALQEWELHLAQSKAEKGIVS